MSIRLAVYQREDRPLDGLCAQLQCAGYDVFERYTESALLDLLGERAIDALLLDSSAMKKASLLRAIKASRDTANLPIMLIAEQALPSLDRLDADVHFDDIIMLPILRDDLRSRVRNVARLASMTTELDRRLASLSDFGIGSQQHHGPHGNAAGRVRILLVGPIGEQQVTLIDVLAETATFTYATTVDHAWHQLCRSCVDMIIVTDKVASGDIQDLCRRVRATRSLTELSILIADGAKSAPAIDRISKDENIDLLRQPYQPVVLVKRIQLMMRQQQLKRQLRGMTADGAHAQIIDNLTGLYGRGFLYHYLDHCLEKDRDHETVLSVATCTISGLANANDMLGYPVGDRLIAQLGKALASSCRAQDLVARACGAGFGVVLNDTSQSEARVVCRRVSEMLEEIVDQSGSNRLSHVHLTIGTAERNADDTAKKLIGRAFQQPELVALRRAS